MIFISEAKSIHFSGSWNYPNFDDDETPFKICRWMNNEKLKKDSHHHARICVLLHQCVSLETRENKINTPFTATASNFKTNSLNNQLSTLSCSLHPTKTRLSIAKQTIHFKNKLNSFYITIISGSETLRTIYPNCKQTCWKFPLQC